MKIVHVCLCSSYNDDWSYQENCLPYYHKKLGHDVTVVTTPFVKDKTEDYQFFRTGEYLGTNGVKIIRLSLLISNKLKLSRKLRIYNGLYKTLQNERPGIIFVHGCQFMDIRHVARYAKENPNVRVFVDNHADFENSARNWLSKNILHRFVWQYCAQAIEPVTKIFWGVLPARVDFLVDFYKLPKEKVKLLVMGADDEKIAEAKDKGVVAGIRDQYKIGKDDFLIVTGGKIDKNKPQTLLLMEAIKSINNKKIKLIVFGSVIPEYEERFFSLLCDSIQYIGWIEAKEAYKYFNAAQLVVFPGLHSVFWEQAVGLGKPCIFRYIDGFNHIDLGGNCKFLYENSVTEIKRVISEIVDNEKVFAHMEKIAQDRGIEMFSYSKIAKKSIEMEQRIAI